MKNKTYILSFNPLIIKYIFAFNILISIGSLSMAQKPFKSGLNFGAKIGTSKLLTEITSGFSETINEFDNKAGIAYSFEVSKYIFPQWEIGLEWNFSVLKGETYSPSFSATGIDQWMKEPITEPLEYHNKLSGPNFSLRYYFKPVFKETFFNPFIRSGIGVLHYESTLKYIDSGEVIFGKGGENGTTLNTPVFNLGTGFKTSLSQRFYLVTSIDFNMVNYDLLDVMHNYDQEGTRLKLYGLYAEFKVGIFYNMIRPKIAKSTSLRYTVSEFLPFAGR